MGRDLVDVLREEVAAGHVVFVVGSGVSLGATDKNPLASWPGLLKHGVDSCHEDPAWTQEQTKKCDSEKVEDLLEVADRVENRLRERGSFAPWLKQTIGSLERLDSTVLNALGDSGCQIATTNYDNLLEDVTNRPTVSWRPLDPVLKFLRKDKDAILHLHGHWEQPDDVVFGLRSYYERASQYWASQGQQILAAMKTMVFVGCGDGLLDPNFARLRQWMTTYLHDAGLMHYRLALASQVSELRQLHRSDKIQVVEYGNDYPDLAPFLRGLGSVGSKARPNLQPQRAVVSDAAQATRLAFTRARTTEPDLLGRALDRKGGHVDLRDVHVRLSIRHDRGESKVRRALQQLHGESGTDFIEETKRTPFLLLRGVPGAGKTTVLRFYANALASALLGEPCTDDQRACVPDGARVEPLLIRLRDIEWPSKYLKDPSIAKTNTALNEIVKVWLAANGLFYPIDTLVTDVAAGRAVLLLDGVDEISDDRGRLAMVNAISAFAHALRLSGASKHARLIVTSRPAAIEGLSFGEQVATAQVLLLSDERALDLALRWTRLANDADSEAAVFPGSTADDRCKSIRRALGREGDPRLRELARNPLFLTLIVLVHHFHGDIPRQRVTLYDQAIDALLRRRYDRESDWSPRRVRECLSEVAWRSFVEPKPARKGTEAARQTEVWVAQHIESTRRVNPEQAALSAQEFLRAQREKSLVLEVPEEPREKFLHRSLREFLAAWHLSNVRESALIEHFRTAARDPSKDQHEMLRLLAGIIASRGSAPASRLVRGVLGLDDVRGGRRGTPRPFAQRKGEIAAAISLLADLRSFDPVAAVVQPIEEDARSLLAALEDEKTTLKDRIAFADALGTFGDPRLRPLDPREPCGPEEWSRRYERWILIRPGEFMYGPHNRLQKTRLQHAFAIQRWLVTIEEYRAFIEAGGYAEKGWWTAEGAWDARESNGWVAPEEWEQQKQKAWNHPVVGVSWYEAKAYCAWLSDRESLEQGERIDLPTDVQWEAVARGCLELPSVDGDEPSANPQPDRDYPWQHAFDSKRRPEFDKNRANTSELKLDRTTPVGVFAAGHGPCGTWDTAGNVFEWCEDACEAKDEAPDEPYYRARLVERGSSRVLRGGSFRRGAHYARCSYRSVGHPGIRNGGIGFRPARVRC